MTGPSDLQKRIATAQRNVALTILGTFAIWLPLQWAGAAFGIPARWLALADLVALAALAWALIMLLRVRRMRREEE
ncbi:DUF5337 family protein [Jannaschia seohaensis]|uniref:Uncharacterized protein n=1 Tax=Jannaschia seohaensis TaxID=475081 RepID=A0A2Y9B7L5_9RHOB|nr:DUF5337 family protein [Jannaschia seohaensis]PWJ12476.1 hypothetical protein BCF38_11634 [Jannaschia seohaensis]SSA50957.1 hypothetical protein SAMN05421539_11634 [Jannaschia seohaensis]